VVKRIKAAPHDARIFSGYIPAAGLVSSFLMIGVELFRIFS